MRNSYSHLRWLIRHPDIGEEKAWVEVGATSLTLKLAHRQKHVIPFDSIEISETAGSIIARRNHVLVANLERERE